MRRLSEVLKNHGDNYIMPFFWQHGESAEKLREYMNAIYNCGIRAVCCECRPHPDFCGPLWWHDMDIILEEAKKLDMKVWILDDAHFPTGQANGRMVDAPDELCKQFLDYREIEIAGPVPGITLDIAELARYEMPVDGDPVDDGEFYHYMLGKLGSSHAHMDPRKKGNSMCEIFGAYGWSEGTRLMKYLADHFLVRGINHYVPHAFSPKEFPDYDCPPHFYAHGLNPLYKGFGHLMRYVNRVCHMINGGKHVAPVAVLYHAEAEWMSREEGYMLTQKPLRALIEKQIDSDIIWLDVLSQRTRYKTILENTLKVSDSEYRMLVIPYSYYIVSALEDFILEARRKNFPVYFVGGRPEKIADRREKDLHEDIFGIPVVSLEELALIAAQYADVRLDKEYTEFCYYHYRHETDLYLFSNESASEIFSGRVMLKGEGVPVLYDAMENQVYSAEWDGDAVCLTLAPYQSVMVVFGYQGEVSEGLRTNRTKQVLSGPWKVSFKNALHQENGFRNLIVIEGLRDMATDHPKFSGWVRYEKDFELYQKENVVLLFEDAYETVEVFVNGLQVGMKICPPYRFDISEYVKQGVNTLVVEVATTLERAVKNLPTNMKDLQRMMFRNQVGYPFGLLGEAAISLPLSGDPPSNTERSFSRKTL